MASGQIQMSRRLVILVFCVLLLISHHAHGAAFFSPGDCPCGYVSGESWYPEGKCERCDCDDDGYSCYTCGVFYLDYNITNCYHYTEDEKLYPECCQPIIKCRGDEGFNEELLIG